MMFWYSTARAAHAELRQLQRSSQIILLLSFLFLPCFHIAAQAAQATPVTLQLRWLHQFQFAGYYAAKHKGYYDEIGLDVEIKAAAPGLEPVKEVLDGHAVYGVANSELLHQRLKGQPLVALAAIFQHSASMFMARQDSAIHSPQDLIGKKVMMISKSADVGLLAMLQNEGVDVSKVKIIKSNYDINSLLNGETDAFNAYLTNEPYFMREQGVPVVSMRPSTYGVDFYSDILFTTEQEISKHPERVKQFRAASLRGWDYAMNNPEEIIDVILKDYSQAKSREHLRFEAMSMRQLIMPNLIQYGHMNPGRWKHMAEVFVKLQMAPADYSLDGFMYDPNPKQDVSGLYATVFLLMLGMITVAGVASALLYYNRKFKHAIEYGQIAQANLQKQTAFFEAIFQSTPDATVICDQKGQVILCNPAFHSIFGYKDEEILGQPMQILYESIAVFKEQQAIHTATQHHSTFALAEINYRHKDGHVFPSRSISGAIFNKNGDHLGCLVGISDITEQKRSQQEIVRMALTDQLTGLANRHQFNRRIGELISLAKRQNQMLSLAIMDLDYFKQVNDEFGHPVGDELLVKIADILKGVFRETDIIARIGGDEFAILMLNPASHLSICQPAKRLIKEFASPLEIAGHQVEIGVSFGIATYPLDTLDPDKLYPLADKALYHAKQSGRSRCSLANEESVSEP